MNGFRGVQERLNSTFISSMKYTYGIDPTKAKDIASLLPTYNDTCQGDSGGPIIIKGSSCLLPLHLIRLWCSTVVLCVHTWFT